MAGWNVKLCNSSNFNRDYDHGLPQLLKKIIVKQKRFLFVLRIEMLLCFILFRRALWEALAFTLKPLVFCF